MFFSVLDGEKINAKCDICKLILLFEHSVSNLKTHLRGKHVGVDWDFGPTLGNCRLYNIASVNVSVSGKNKDVQMGKPSTSNTETKNN